MGVYEPKIDPQIAGFLDNKDPEFRKPTEKGKLLVISHPKRLHPFKAASGGLLASGNRYEPLNPKP